MLLKLLSQGELGVRLSTPPGLIREDTEFRADILDRDRGLVWNLLFEPLVTDLSPATAAQRRADAEATARTIFRLSEGGPRLEDPTWSPVVEDELRMVGGAPCLRVIHRAIYKPGVEVLMGHLVVPTRHGTLEIRVIAAERGSTGTRESAVLLIRMQKNPGAMPELLPQAAYDDPALDAAFPEHPLSVVRAALNGLEAPNALRTEPAPTVASGRVPIAKFGSIILPPRFAAAAYPSAYPTFSRSTFALTDGVWRLSAVPSEGQRVSGARDLVVFARRTLATMFGELPEPRIEARQEPIEVDFPEAPLTSVWRAVDGVPLGLVLSWPQEIPREAARALIRDAFGSWRR